MKRRRYLSLMGTTKAVTALMVAAVVAVPQSDKKLAVAGFGMVQSVLPKPRSFTTSDAAVCRWKHSSSAPPLAAAALLLGGGGIGNSKTNAATRGEKRLARQLQQKLPEDCVVWYNVRIGKYYPDFVVLSPAHGILVLEVKDWIPTTIVKMNPKEWKIRVTTTATMEQGNRTGGGSCDYKEMYTTKTVLNPLEQVKRYVHEVDRILGSDPVLRRDEQGGDGRGKVKWGYGVVLTGITRRQFNDDLGISDTILPHHLVVCKDEMVPSITPKSFQDRLWRMFPYPARSTLSKTEIDRVRWNIFPEIRVVNRRTETLSEGCFISETSSSASEEESTSPGSSIVRVMDMKQEELARNLGEGHRVVHGVAGSGKTMLLIFLAEQLSRQQQQQVEDDADNNGACNNNTNSQKPILVVCYNTQLATYLANAIKDRGIHRQVQAMTFHSWCRHQLMKFNQAVPRQSQEKKKKGEIFTEIVHRVILAVDQGSIPEEQYSAILIDEGHDFQPEWLKLLVLMLDREIDRLLLLYDDAQSIYKTKGFTLKSVGIRAQGRTSILRLNYRNTRQILEFATSLHLAGDRILAPRGQDREIIPLEPTSCRREGRMPVITDSIEEALRKLEDAKSNHGYSWSDMAVLCRFNKEMDACAEILYRHRIPFSCYRGGNSSPRGSAASVAAVGGGGCLQLMTIHASKGLEFPVVAIVGAPAAAWFIDQEQESQVWYVAITRAMDHLILVVNDEMIRRLRRVSG